MADSEFTISIENLDRFCRIVCDGRFNEEVFRHLVNLMKKDQSQSAPGKRYLVDLRGTNYSLDTLARFRIGEYSAQQLGNARIAVLGNRGTIDKITENTAFNRGLSVLVTHVFEEAVAWAMSSHGRERTGT